VRNVWPYGSGSKGLPDFFLNTSKEDSLYLNYYWHANDSVYYKNGSGDIGPAGLFYYRIKSQTALRNELEVRLKYMNGNELIPVVKRTITLGKWEYNDDEKAKTNELKKLDNDAIATITSFLVADEVEFLPKMDRGSGTAKFVYKDNLLKILDTYPVIISIKYEVSLSKEVGTTPGEEGGSVYSDRTMMRGLIIEAEDSITTDPNVIGTGGIIYVPSQKDFVFTAYSDEEIEVTTDRGTDDQGGVDVKNNNDGSYTITIRRVRSTIKISIKKFVITESGAGGDNGETANTTITGDAVWAAGGTLYVQTANAGTLAIYNITGQLYKVENISGSYTLSMPKGVYIVQLNGKAYKVVL
jgi:hypothetical protein